MIEVGENLEGADLVYFKVLPEHYHVKTEGGSEVPQLENTIEN